MSPLMDRQEKQPTASTSSSGADNDILLPTQNDNMNLFMNQTSDYQLPFNQQLSENYGKKIEYIL